MHSCAQIAVDFEVTRQTVRNWIARGVRGVRLKASQVGGKVRVDRAEVERFQAALAALAAQKEPTPAPTIGRTGEAEQLKKRGLV